MERDRKRRWRKTRFKALKEEEKKLQESRQKAKARVSAFRRRQKEKVEEKKSGLESDIARKIVTNLRARLDKNKGSKPTHAH